MSQPALKRVTPEEYLALEEQAEYKSEYFAGKIFAMAGASYEHNSIVMNIISAAGPKVRDSKCRLHGLDLRLWIEEKDVFTYPDVMIICGEPEFYFDRNDTVTNPLIIIEVLSESTKNYDRGEKFEMYRAISTLREYVLIDQNRVHVERFVKTESGWVLSEWNDAGATVQFVSVDFHMPISDIYRGIEFPAPQDPEQESAAD